MNLVLIFSTLSIESFHKLQSLKTLIFPPEDIVCLFYTTFAQIELRYVQNLSVNTQYRRPCLFLFHLANTCADVSKALFTDVVEAASALFAKTFKSLSYNIRINI